MLLMKDGMQMSSLIWNDAVLSPFINLKKYIVVYFYFVRQWHKTFFTFFVVIGSSRFWIRSTKRQPTVSKSFETTIFKHQISIIIIKIDSSSAGSWLVNTTYYCTHNTTALKNCN